LIFLKTNSKKFEEKILSENFAHKKFLQKTFHQRIHQNEGNQDLEGLCKFFLFAFVLEPIFHWLEVPFFFHFLKL